MFLLRTTGTWSDPVFSDGRFFPFYVAWLVGRCAEWPIPGVMDTRGWTGGGSSGGDASRLGNSRWGVSANLVGPRMPRVFRPWGATLLRMMDDVKVRFRMTVGMCRQMTRRIWRPHLCRWAEVTWFLMGAGCVCLNEGCDLLERLCRHCRNPWWGSWMWERMLPRSLYRRERRNFLPC